ncbi:MAG: poly(A) polymerase [Gammaproteobacteria bacterium]
MLDTLQEAGFAAYLVGGGVRDLLLNLNPKDFDIATEANPDQVKELFGRSCRLIGRRFRLAHVRMGREVLEVATFRGTPEPDEKGSGNQVNDSGRIVRDNVYGTLEEDVWRRDFSVNSLYYSAADETVLDFVGGMADLQARELRMIGEAEVRYREDPVRMLRAIRFSAKLDFKLEKETDRAIDNCAQLLQDIPAARLYDETLKLFMGGHAQVTFDMLQRYRLFEFICPETAACVDDMEDEQGLVARFLKQALANTDARIREDKPVTPAFLFAALLWEPVKRDSKAIEAQGMSTVQAIDSAGVDVLARQVEHVAMPRRFSLIAREIWCMQPRLIDRGSRRVGELVENPRFRAGYDFLLLRGESGENVVEHGNWWTKFQEADEAERAAMIEQASRSGGGSTSNGNGNSNSNSNSNSNNRSPRGKKPRSRKKGNGTANANPARAEVRTESAGNEGNTPVADSTGGEPSGGKKRRRRRRRPRRPAQAEQPA